MLGFGKPKKKKPARLVKVRLTEKRKVTRVGAVKRTIKSR
jgi:hypothetical protein